MNKRILKRHKRQVARAKQRTQISEPDVRTPEQIQAAREISRPATRRRSDPWPSYPAQPAKKRAESPPDSSGNRGV